MSHKYFMRNYDQRAQPCIRDVSNDGDNNDLNKSWRSRATTSVRVRYSRRTEMHNPGARDAAGKFALFTARIVPAQNAPARTAAMFLHTGLVQLSLKRTAYAAAWRSRQGGHAPSMIYLLARRATRRTGGTGRTRSLSQRSTRK